MNAARTAAPNPTVGMIIRKKITLSRKRYLTGTSSPMTNVYEYPEAAEIPTIVWSPIRSKILFAVATVILPMTPSRTPEMENHPLPKISDSLAIRVKPITRPEV
jgi:hypothetical protein